MSKRQQIPQTEWLISSMRERSCPASTFLTASGRLSSLTIRCWDRSIRPLWHMVLIWSLRRLLNMWRSFRPDCRRMFGSGRYTRTDPRHAHDPGHDVRSAYRLVADAFTRDPKAQNDGRGGRRAQGRNLPRYSSKGRVGLVSRVLAG